MARGGGASGKGQASSKPVKTATSTAKLSQNATRKGGRKALAPAARKKMGAPAKAPPPGQAAPRADAAAWAFKELLQTDAKGKVKPTDYNAQLILDNDPRWKGVLAYDEFIGDIVALRPPPWGPLAPAGGSRAGDWSDKDIMRAGVWLQANYEMAGGLSEKAVFNAVVITADKTHVHPVRDWLRSLKWDGKPRLDDWLIRLGGAEDNPYVRAVASKFLIGAVARVFEPGCKVDCMPVFEGKQGLGKSTLVKVLAGDGWFMETNIQMGTKDSYMVLRRKWIVEIGELASMQRSEWENIKLYLSTAVDTYRASYARSVADFKRQCVFAGTTNADIYLKDDTGSRRFWPVALRKVLIKALRRERVQLWAEATFRYLAKEVWHFDDPQLTTLAAEIADARRMADPMQAKVAAWLEKLPKVRQYTGVSTNEVLEAMQGRDPVTGEKREVDWLKTDRGHLMRAASILRSCGWEHRHRRADGDRDYVYSKYPPGTMLVGIDAKHGQVVPIMAGSLRSSGRKPKINPGPGLSQRLKDMRRGKNWRSGDKATDKAVVNEFVKNEENATGVKARRPGKKPEGTSNT